MSDRHILQNQLNNYVSSGPYPMHMPGHKRRMAPAPELPARWDMTEVPGVDDLHEAEGILKDAMDRTARLHGAAQTWYLVGGSTCGLLAGIRALAPMASTIIAARNCHKAVYHAIELGNLSVRWLTPPVEPVFGVYGSISPAAVAEALACCPEASCVVLTSPTYEGVLSDISAIASLCHEKGVPLLVDEAHGAHLGLFPSWPDSALHLGADLVVQSAHKTLPSLTQTALLHLGRDSLADPQEVERQLDIFETSSPSYPLLASLDGCTGILSHDGEILFRRWREMLTRFDQKTASLRHLRVLCHGRDLLGNHPAFFDFDPGKLPICTNATPLTGTALAERLRKHYGFETEMACGEITLAMTSLCDEAAALDRFAEALVQIDETLADVPLRAVPLLPPPGESVTTIARAVLHPADSVPMHESIGRISAEYVWAYPPGVPLVAPGECITPAFLTAMEALARSGTRLHHSRSSTPCKMVVFA